MSNGLPTLTRDGANLATVRVGNLEVAFSYSTAVGFYSPATGWVISENLWGSTTGKHINALPGGSNKGARVGRDKFDAMLAEACAGIGGAA